MHHQLTGSNTLAGTASHRSRGPDPQSSDPGAARWHAFVSGPPANSDIRLTLPARPENVAVVRQVLGALAEALQLPPTLVEDLRLAVTEACTNVVRHAYQDGQGPIDVTIHPDGDTLRVVVADRGRGIGPSNDQLGPGLGLPLIASLADDLEIDHHPAAGSSVSMTFSRHRGR